MAKISILLAFLTHFLCAFGQSQLSQCSRYFTHVTKPGTTDMLGQIEIQPPSANDIFYLKVALSTTTKLDQVVRLELARSIKESVRHVHQGRPLLYHVYYPNNEQIPSLSAIWFNSHRYCPDSEVSENITANVELGHILSAPNEEPLVYGPWQEISQPYHRNSSDYRIDNPSYDRLNHYPALSNECGITSYYTDDTNRLIPDGETTLPGQWPWLVAIYVQDTDNETEHRFKCTGSILTTRHIITSGPCLILSRPEMKKVWPVNPQRVIVRFGQLKSLEWHVNHTGIINRVVVDYKISSDHFQNFGNLAILILKTAVQYNAFIKPICRWSGSTSLQDNITGYIVGWGKNFIRDTYLGSGWGTGHWEWYTGELRMEKVPFMNLSVNTRQGIALIDDDRRPTNACYDIGNGLMAFNTITGRYELLGVLYYCGRWITITHDNVVWIYSAHPFEESNLNYDARPDSNYCYSDVGGGIVVFNTTTDRYQLYAIKGQCHGNGKLVKFVDVAKLTSWIRQQIYPT